MSSAIRDSNDCSRTNVPSRLGWRRKIGPRPIDADFVIGADGAHSTVREQLNIRFEGHRMPGDWSLADVRLDALVSQESRERPFR